MKNNLSFFCPMHQRDSALALHHKLATVPPKTDPLFPVDAPKRYFVGDFEHCCTIHVLEQNIGYMQKPPSVQQPPPQPYT